MEDYKVSVYGENHDQEEAENNAAKSTMSDAAKKRKAIVETAVQECANYEWADLADNGKVKALLDFLHKSYFQNLAKSFRW